MNWKRTAVAVRFILVMLSQRTLLQMLQPRILDYKYSHLAKPRRNCWRRWLGAQGSRIGVYWPLWLLACLKFCAMNN